MTMAAIWQVMMLIWQRTNNKHNQDGNHDDDDDDDDDVGDGDGDHDGAKEDEQEPCVQQRSTTTILCFAI